MPLNLTTINKDVNAIKQGEPCTLTSLSGSSPALIFSLLEPPSLLITSSEESAAELYSDALFWARSLGKDAPVMIDTGGSPERLKVLHTLYEDNGRSFIASVKSALVPLWSKKEFEVIKVSKGLNVERELLVMMLQDAGYHTVPIVFGIGEMSIRGGIIDLFSPDKEFPLRIEFFGDDIDSIRLFDIDTQLTLQETDEAAIYPAVEPDEGPDLIELLDKSRLLLHETDDIRNKYPELYDRLSDRNLLHLTSLPLSEEHALDLKITGVGGLGLLREERNSIDEFVDSVGELKESMAILMACSSEGQANRLRDLFAEKSIDCPALPNDKALSYQNSPVITIGRLGRGFRHGTSVVLSEEDIFGKRPAFRSIRKSKVSKLVSSIEDFREGDFLVHIDHGIGKYLGITQQRTEDFEGDFLTLEYLGGDRIYLPLERINYVQKFQTPEHAAPKPDKLGTQKWLKTKARIKKKIKDMAEKLVKLYAKRSSVKGHAFPEDTELHAEFDGFFPYEETPDQSSAIAEIKKDMEKPSPMDMLLCGDVGYGKTEVAMRAAFKAVFDAKQVAILVPTTVLAEQHYNTFTERFSAFPVKIGMLSRFTGSTEQKATIKSMAEGDIDIIIGTHKLLGKSISFYDLGLLIIDEEHKFGVTHKEKIKAIKTSVDILSLTATPIPRTLHMALSGIRGLSVIETPPEERLAVKSIVSKLIPDTLKEAIQYEIDRGGQVFFLHNRVKEIDGIAAYIKGLVPDSKIGVAHGQMKGSELEDVMHSFYSKKTNLLVSTNIIGSGLDIPSANTIIINRADRFGLADLYQLRGRVGRSNVKAYAYFLIPDEETITEDARKKLSAIKEMSYLGAGFRLALKDLEIRGAGNLLGQAQSGHIEAVGFDLYVQMLEEAVAEIKGENTLPRIETVVNLKKSAVLSEKYIEDPSVRLSIYRKISSIKHAEDTVAMKDELKDRFGEPPDEALHLIDMVELKLMAQKLGIAKIESSDGMISILFAEESPVSPESILSLYDKKERGLRFLPERGIKLDMKGKNWDKVYSKLKRILKKLSE